MKALHLCKWLVVGSCLASCTGSESDYVPQITNSDSGSPLPSVFAATLTVPALTTVVQGTSNNKVVVGVHRTNGYTGPVFVRVDGLPGGLRADPITIADAANQGEIELVADTDMPAQGNVDPAPKVVASQADGNEPSTEAPLPLFVRGKPGTLDTTFADGGVNVTPYACIDSVLTQSDGKIVIAGDPQPFTDNIIRLNADGSPDPTFAFSAPGYPHFIGGYQTISADDRIVTVGNGDIDPTPTIRVFNSDGSLDTDFNHGAASVVVPAPGGYQYFWPHVITVAPDGNIYIGGEVSPDGYIAFAFSIAQISSYGVVQTSPQTIGSNCLQVWNPNSNHQSYLTDLFVLPSGALTFIGYDGQSIGVGRFRSYNVSSDCTWDPNYGGVGGDVASGTGTAPTTGNNGVSYFTNWTTADASLLDDDGSFVILAHTSGGQPYSLVRVDPTGRQVTSAPSLVFSSTESLSRTQDGHYLVTGSYIPPGESYSFITVAFHKSDLTLDTSVGNQGITVIPNRVVNDYGPTYEVGIRAIPTPDGQHTIVVGYDVPTADNPYYEHLIVARLWN